MTETASSASARKGKGPQEPPDPQGQPVPPAGRGGLTMARIYTTPGVHPYDEVTWERRDVVTAGQRLWVPRG